MFHWFSFLHIFLGWLNRFGLPLVLGQKNFHGSRAVLMSTEGSCQFSSVPPSCRGSLIKQGSVPPSCRAVSVRGRIGSVRTKPGGAGTTTLIVMLPLSQPPSLDSGHPLPATIFVIFVPVVAHELSIL